MEKKTAEHHKRYEYCKSRPSYRQGRELKAVKVYTVAQESQYLLVFGVPRVNLSENLQRHITKIAVFESCQCVSEEMAKKVELESFTDVFTVKFPTVKTARIVKRKLDATQFYGGILHISYAPEYETLDELRTKLATRRKEVALRKLYNSGVQAVSTSSRD